MKHLDKFFNKWNLPWVKMLWNKYNDNNTLPPHATLEKKLILVKGYFPLIPLYMTITTIQINKGDTALLWKDQWCDNIMELVCPSLYSFTMNEDISVSTFK